MGSLGKSILKLLHANAVVCELQSWLHSTMILAKELATYIFSTLTHLRLFGYTICELSKGPWRWTWIGKKWPSTKRISRIGTRSVPQIRQEQRSSRRATTCRLPKQQ